MLKIAKNSGLTDVVSVGQKKYMLNTDNTQQVDTIPTGQESNYSLNPKYNPVTTSHPTTGGSQTVQLWLFDNGKDANDATYSQPRRWENITIDPTDAVSTDESSWVQLSADGTTWQTASAPLSMANISDTTGHTFYVKVTSPSGQSVANKTDIKLTVNYREFAV